MVTTEETAKALKQGLSAQGVTWLGLAVNVGLGVAKVAVGVLTGSKAILADGLHSASDLVTDVVILASLAVSEKPADHEHQYGHHRANSLAALLVGIALLATAGWLAYSAAGSLRHPSQPIRSYWPLAMALVSIPAKEVLFRITRAVGRRLGNPALRANAWHHRSDAFTSVAAAAGLAGAAIGGEDWAFLDPATALGLSGFLLLAAIRTISQSGSELMDRSPGRRTMEAIAAVMSQTPGVRDFHAFRARQLGGQIAMDVHVQVDPALTVRQGHGIAADVRRRIQQADPQVLEVIVHVEPYESSTPG